MTKSDRPESGGMDSFTARWLHDNLRNRIAVNEQDGSVLVYVPAGEFEMGDGQGNDCTKDRVYLSAYWIGVYCITNTQYLKFVEATNHPPPDKADYGTPVWQGKRFPAEKADHPVVCVNWEDAQAYARWAGCELPTEAQWEKAARGPLGLLYPWGKDWDETKCRHDKNKGSETTARVYDYPTGVSGYGTYNQSGNVWEWCADWYDSKLLRPLPRARPSGAGYRLGPGAPGRGLVDRRPGVLPGGEPHRVRPRRPRRPPGVASREGGFVSPCLPWFPAPLAGRRKRRRLGPVEQAGLMGFAALNPSYELRDGGEMMRRMG